MSFVAGFTINPSVDPSVISLTQNNTGTDGGITSRSISLYQYDGSLLVPAINWPLANATINLSVLAQDVALNIVVTYLSSSPLPPPSVYVASQIYAFNGFGNAFLYQLTQYISSNYTIIQDQDYYSNKLKLIVEIDSSQNAINIGLDLAGAQSSIDRYNYLIQNSKYFY